MFRNAGYVIVVLLYFALSVMGKNYLLTIQKGGAEIIRSETGEQLTVSDSADVAPKDMISLLDEQQAFVVLEQNSFLLIKGPSELILSETGNTLSVELARGQVFIIRKQPFEFALINISSDGYTFTPIGTKAAVKKNPESKPTVAVLEGKIRMQSPSAEAIMIEEGYFGNVDRDGRLTSGKLSQRAIESLNQWLAGVSVYLNASTENKQTSAMATMPPDTYEKSSPGHKNNESSSSETAEKTPENEPSSQSTPSGSIISQQKEQKEIIKEEKPTGEKPLQISESAARKEEKTPAPPESPKWEISAFVETVDDKQWTKMAIGFDLPIWKFGVFFDIEMFIDSEGRISDKGWNFREDWMEALARKIRYVRFGQEGEPLFVKLGGLSSVSFGYGFLVDRFTNMLHYPDRKLLGFQMEINDLSPIGITLQALIADFREFDFEGGIAGARIALKPLKNTGIPIVNGIKFGGAYVTDLNQYAPAQKWKFKEPVSVQLLRDFVELGADSAAAIDTLMVRGFNDPRIDNEKYLRDKKASSEKDPFGLIGADVGIPLISTGIIGLDLYGQAGMRDDGTHGWGIGAPGLALKVWRMWANVEYRRVLGRFQPGYFGTYYLDERLIREPVITTKEQRLVSDTLNGIFGRLGFNIADVVFIQGDYQYMKGKQEISKDQRFEATGSLGGMVLERIPKLNRAEAYFYKSRIGNENDRFFEKTVFMYFGYRIGFEIAPGASLIWDSRYGYRHDEKGNLIPNNNISIQTAVSF